VIGTNTSFDAKNTATGKRPIYVFSIGGQARVYSTHDLTREGISGIVPEFRAWLKTPRGASQSIDVLNGTSSIGELECEVVDQAGEVRQLVGSTTLEGASATLLLGYPGMDYAQFIPLHSYTLFRILPSRNYTSWLFRARDRQMSAKRTVWQNPLNGLPLEESNPWILQGTPAEIVQAIYLFALGRPVEEIDRTGMSQLDAGSEGLFKVVRPFLFMLNEPTEAKQFLEQEIYKVCGLYPVIDNNGKISLKPFRAPASGPQAVYTFDDSNMVVFPEIDRMEIVNEIVFKFDAKGSDFANTLMFVDQTSISLYGRARQHSIESKGLRTELGALWFCEEIASRLFRRFAGTPAALRGGAPIARIEAFLMTLPVWVGDFVNVTHPKMPNLLTGALGVTHRLYEVIDREPDFARGRMRFRLLDTGLTGQQAAYQFAPSGRDAIIEVSTIY
jgi:hypothetical protein